MFEWINEYMRYILFENHIQWSPCSFELQLDFTLAIKKWTQFQKKPKFISEDI